MAVQTQSVSQIKKKKSDALASDALASENLPYLLSDIDTILAISVLKYFSTEADPLSIRQISDSVYDFRSAESDMDSNAERKDRDSKNKKIGHKLGDLAALARIRDEIAERYHWKDAPCYDDLSEKEAFYCSLADLLCLAFGGFVRCTEKGVRKFYFQPLIKPSHIDLIRSCLMANQYFTEKESSYLIRAVESLGASSTGGSLESAAACAKDFYAQEAIPLFLRDYIQERYAFLSDSMDTHSIHSYPLLHTISQLYAAITKGVQIEMTIGSYQKSDRSGKIALKTSHPERAPYHLNPYAIFFSDGHHYLIATKTSDTAREGELDKVLHFRVDRITMIASLDRPREPRPESLHDYWQDKKIGFDQQLYSKIHPTMAYSEKCATQKATLLTKHPIALSIVADAFGKDTVRITKEAALPDPNAPDAAPRIQYEIEVYAQKDNIVRFCSQQHALVKLIRPAALVEEVIQTLRLSLSDYT